MIESDTLLSDPQAGRSGPDRELSILHVLRAPIGGLFRHVVDLAEGQIALGHRVGIVADSLTVDIRAAKLFEKLEPTLRNGLTLIPIDRSISFRDILIMLRISTLLKRIAPDIVHGHGAKGGAFARLAASRRGAISAYTPHGGSLLLVDGKFKTKMYLALERALLPLGGIYLFESEFSALAFENKVGKPRQISRVVHNGVAETEFSNVSVARDATDTVFIGELRAVKGARIFLEAISQLHTRGHQVTATVVGDGPERAPLEQYARESGLSPFVHFIGSISARQAMRLGHVVIVPSLAESFPYIVLEATAAGRPIVATNVGGVAEILGPLQSDLVKPGQAEPLAEKIFSKIQNPEEASIKAAILRDFVAKSFRLERMVNDVQKAYLDAIALLEDK